MKKILFSLLVALCVLTVPALASADDIMPPDWRGEYGSTHAEWNSWAFDGVSFVPDVFTQNPSEPQLLMPWINPSGGYQAASEGVWFFDSFALALDNFEYPNPVKEIRLQITYQNQGFLPGIGSVTGSPPVDWEPYLVASVPVLGSPGWFTDVWDLTLWPNPGFEFVLVDDFPFLLVSQVVVDTLCAPAAVPVPGAVWLLGSGLIGLLGLRRKFKS